MVRIDSRGDLRPLREGRRLSHGPPPHHQRRVRMLSRLVARPKVAGLPAPGGERGRALHHTGHGRSGGATAEPHSCSSCHQRFGGKFDRDTPRQTCAKCHNGYPQGAEKSFVNADRPNCVSCHVQHYYDNYRWGDLLTQSAKEKRQAGIDKNYLDAVKQSAVR